jgi:hypothetical protein
MRLTSRLLAMICLAGAPTFVDAQINCNLPAAQPITYVEFPAHPFGVIASTDGCWLFVSLNTADPRSPNGLAVLRRASGTIQTQRIVPLEGGPLGMIMTHDGQLLIVADSEFVVFLDVNKLRSGEGDPILGYMRDGQSSGSIYVNVDTDDRYLFVSGLTNYNANNLEGSAKGKGAVVGSVRAGLFPRELRTASPPHIRIALMPTCSPS